MNHSETAWLPAAPAHIAGFPAYAPSVAGDDAGFDPALFRAIADCEPGHFWFRARNRLLLWLLARFGSTVDDFLEIGCGSGYVLGAIHARFPHWRLVGSEVHVAGLAIARERLPDLPLLQLDATAMPFEGCFDGIGAFDVIEHIADADAALAGIRRALRPGGLALFSVPQHPGLWSHADVLAHHQRRYARGELERTLRAHGFSIVWSGSFNSLLLPLLWLARLRAPATDPLAEFHLPRALDALLGAVLALEIALLRLGLRWPFGGSRVVVARATGWHHATCRMMRA